MKFFTTSSPKNIIATLRIVTIDISELTFLLTLYLHPINVISMLREQKIEKFKFN